MANNKKYYYLKLKDNFFDSDEMKLLEGMPEGYKYSNILLKLYLRSLKDDGRLMLNNHIPYSEQMIASVTGHSVGDVTAALSVFQDLGLIEKLDNGAIYMLDIQNFIGQSSTEAERKKAYRNKIKSEKGLESSNRQVFIEKGGQMSGQTSDNRTPEIELEIEKDIDIEKEQQLQSKNKKPVISGQITPEYRTAIINYYQGPAKLGMFPPAWYQDLDQDFADWLKLNSDPKEVANIFCMAIKETSAVTGIKKPFKYMQHILDNWERDNHTSLADVKAILSKSDHGSDTNQKYNYRKRTVIQKETEPEWMKDEQLSEQPSDGKQPSPETLKKRADIERRLKESGLKK